jgi:hypothetical protein
MSYAHAEAFCLMRYLADDGSGEDEVIWNARDGVTPFVISLRSGKTAIHVGWRNDECAPDFVPPPGSRMFVDLTPERARQHAERNVKSWNEEQGSWPEEDRTFMPSVEDLAKDYLFPPGAPDLVEVPAV